jgi:hypothetical protein
LLGVLRVLFNVTKVTGLERDKGSVRGKGPEGEPHERYRHETRPEGSGGRKPARGWETLKPEGVGRGNPEVTGPPELISLKGREPHESCCWLVRWQSGPVKL